MGGIIQSGGRDTGSGLTNILNVSKYYRPEVGTSGRLLHEYLLNGPMTTLRFFTISKNMLDPTIGVTFLDNFPPFSWLIACFLVHVWALVSGAGHGPEQM